MDESIRVRHLKKSYGDIKAVDDINFTVKKNEIFAFLGPNGAGKSTTIAMLCTLMDVEEGEIIIEGYKRTRNDDEIRNVLGVVFQGSVLDDTLTIKQNLLLRCGLYGMFLQRARQRVQDLLMLCSLEDIQNQKVKELSGGQRRRVDIARALIPSPKVLILDEPSTGLDPKSRKDLWTMIQVLKSKQQMTIFMTTHYMEEAEIADHICMINKGSIILNAHKDDLMKQYQRDRIRLYGEALHQIEMILKQYHYTYRRMNAYVEVYCDTFYQLMSLLRQVERYVHHVEMHKWTIEDVYLDQVKEECE